MTTYTWPEILSASEKVSWRVEDLIGPDQSFDFSRPFLPETLARTRQLEFLTPREQLLLNQIRAHGYLYLFGVVEEFIVPFVLDHLRPGLGGDPARDRSLLTFVDEEAKHIDLFRRFHERFRKDFGTECQVIGPPAAIGAAVLAHDPLSVGLVILQIEWMTQRHYLDSIENDQSLDARFKSLMRHHWMEESQHAKADNLIVAELAATRDADARAAAVEGYLAIGKFVDEGLAQQARFDLDSLERASGRQLSAAERERFLAVQHQAMRWTYLGSGMVHPRFQAALSDLGDAMRARVDAVAPAFA